jgi:hypothetical protein
MTPTRFRIVKHLTATVFALTLTGLLVLGFDGIIGAMQKLTRVYATRPPPTPAEAPAAEAPATPGVVPAFIVPADAAKSGAPARKNHN